MVVAEAIGRGLVVEPYLATVVLGGGLVTQAGSEAQKADILPRIASGATLLAFAHGEPQGRYELAHVATRPEAGRPTGRKSVVVNGDAADLDRKSVVQGQSVSVRVDIGGRRLI